jgi:hypothetical protein
MVEASAAAAGGADRPGVLDRLRRRRVW